MTDVCCCDKNFTVHSYCVNGIGEKIRDDLPKALCVTFAGSRDQLAVDSDVALGGKRAEKFHASCLRSNPFSRAGEFHS